MKFDERQLLNEIQSQTRLGKRPHVGVIAALDFGMNDKRAAYLCEKWERKGWYEYGVNVMVGWLTDKGMKA